MFARKLQNVNVKTKLYLRMLFRKFFFRTICSVNNFRKNRNNFRKNVKTTSFFLQQNFHFECCKKFSNRRFEMKCHASQWTQNRFMNSKIIFRIFKFQLHIKTIRKISRLSRRRFLISIINCKFFSRFCDCFANSKSFVDFSNSFAKTEKLSFINRIICSKFRKFFNREIFLREIYCETKIFSFSICNDNDCEISFCNNCRCNRKFRIFCKWTNFLFIFFCKRCISICKLCNFVSLFAQFVFNVTKNRKIKRNRFADECKIKWIHLKKCDENSKSVMTLNATARRLQNSLSFWIILTFSFDNNFRCENRKRDCEIEFVLTFTNL